MEGEVVNEFGQPVLGYCVYCHREIFVGESYQTTTEGLYHTECYEIKDLFYDPMDDEDE